MNLVRGIEGNVDLVNGSRGGLRGVEEPAQLELNPLLLVISLLDALA